LILDDLDLLATIARSSWCAIAFTITSMDDAVSSFLEPNAPSPRERFRALGKIKSDHPQIQVGVNLIPIVPFLEDDMENVEAIVKEAKYRSLDFILFSPGMTFRDLQAKYFIDKLETYDPGIARKFLRFYGGREHPPGEWSQQMNLKIYKTCKKYNIKVRINRFIPNDYRKTNYKVSEYLLNKAYKMQIFGKPYKSYFWAGQNIQNLKVSISTISSTGRLNKIQGLNEAIIEEIKPFLKKENLDLFF